MEEDTSIAYRQTHYILDVIDNKLENLEDSMRSFQDTLGRSLLIDGIPPEEEKIKKMIRALNEVSTNIKNDTLPFIENEIGD